MKKKTIVIDLFGGPGSGKSSALFDIMSYCKKNNIDAEAATEYAKEPIVRGVKLVPTDQVYLLAKQHKKESTFYGKTDYIITDCPMWMSIAYEKELSNPPYVAKKIIEKYLAHSPNVEHRPVLIKRPKNYNPSGRRQSEDEATEFDKNFLFPVIKEEFGDSILTFTTGKFEVEELIEALGIK